MQLARLRETPANDERRSKNVINYNSRLIKHHMKRDQHPTVDKTPNKTQLTSTVDIPPSKTQLLLTAHRAPDNMRI